MALYSNNIYTELYKYSKPIYVTEVSGQDRTLVPLKINLNASNFNFDLTREDGLDFRLAESSNGSGVLLMWIAYWSYDNETATIWFKLPTLAANETKELWAFWGFAGDGGISDITRMTDSNPIFLFAEGFDDEVLDVTKWTSSVGSWSLQDSKINLAVDAWIRSKNCLGGQIDIWKNLDSKLTITAGLWGNHQHTSACYLAYTGILNYTQAELIDGDVTSYNTYSYVSRFGGCGIGVDMGAVVGNIKKVRFYLYNYLENYNNDLVWDDPGAYNTNVTLYKSETNISGDQVLIKSYNAYELQGLYPVIKYQDYVWYFDIVFDAPGEEFRYLHMFGQIQFTTTVTFRFSEVEVYTDDFTTTIVPSKFIVEEGVIGEGSPTSTDSYAHRYQFLGGENPFEIKYFWEGAIDRQHNFIDSAALQTYAGTNKGLVVDGYSQNFVAYFEDTDRIYQGMINRQNEADYEDNWERQVHRNTEVSSFRIYGSDITNSDGLVIDWVVAREYDPDIEPEINLSNLFIDYEYVPHQQLDYTEYGSDITNVDFYHASNMGGDPYRLSDDVVTGISNAFVSNENTTKGYVFIDFGRLKDRENNEDYLHLTNSADGFYNAAKLSDLETDAHNRTYWQATKSSGVWAAIKFPERITIASISVKAVPGATYNMIQNYRIYGSNSDPRFNGWQKKVLLKTGQFLNVESEQVVYLTNTTSYFYYILEAVDTYGGNAAVQEWSFYKRTPATGKKVLSQIRLRPVVDNINEYYFPKQIKIQASNDLMTWVTLLNTVDTATPFTDYAYGRWQRFSFDNFDAYYIYRITCYDNWHAPIDQIKISEWEMVERAEESNTYRILYGSTNDLNSIWTVSGTSFDSGYFYITNDYINTIFGDTFIEASTTSGITSDINVIGS